MRNLDNNIVKEIEYINKTLRAKKKGFNRIAEEDYNKTGNELEQQIIDLGYVKNKIGKVNQYVLQDVGQDVGQSTEKKKADNVGQKGGVVVQEVIQEKADNVGQVGGVVVHQQKKQLNNILNNYDVLMEMIAQYQNKANEFNSSIEIKLPMEEDKSYKTSLRVNKVVFEQFKEFCNNNKTFSQKDLLSMALVEYMERHK